MYVELFDGSRLWVEELGDGFPLVLLHGGPGFDHSMFRPWLDALADEFRLLYVDERGQGRSDRVDPESLSLERFARDVDELAEALALEQFVLLGHSFGAIIATWHAVELGTAAGYVISGGADSSAALEADVAASLAALGDAGREIAESWELERTVETEEQLAELWSAQAPFHFFGPPVAFPVEPVYSPAVLRHFARAGYGGFDYLPGLGRVDRPTLVIVGEHDRTTTPRASLALHRGIRGSELVVVPGAGHLSYIEATAPYLEAARTFLRRVASQTHR